MNLFDQDRCVESPRKVLGDVDIQELEVVDIFDLISVETDGGVEVHDDLLGVEGEVVGTPDHDAMS